MTNQPPKYIAHSPYCEHELDPATAVDGRVTCECGRSSDARWVRELGWLQARTEFVVDRIKAGDTWYDTATGKPAAEKPKSSLAGEQLLYILGGLSLLVAVGVFAAVSWETLGVAGQAGILLGVTLASASAAIFLRDRITGLANTLAVLSSTFLGVLFFAATSFGLFPESWNRASHWYPVSVIFAISIASFGLGWAARITGWFFVTPLGLAVSVVLLVQTVIPRYFNFNLVDYLNPIIYALFIMLLNRFGWALSKHGNTNRALPIIQNLVQAFLVFVAFTSSIEIGFSNRTEPEQIPWLFGVALIFAGAALAHMAYRWADSDHIQLDERVARYLSSFVVGAGLSFLFAAPARTSLMYAEAISVITGGVIGLAILLWPLINSKQKFADAFIVPSALGLWATHAVFAVSRLEGNGQDSRVFGAVFFALVTTGALVRWWNSDQVLWFVLGAASGFGAILQVMLEIENRHPEPTTALTAIWLAVILQILRRRSAPGMNSGIWLGVPLGTFLLPSAAIAVGRVDYYGAETLDWVRLWVVLVAGIGFTLLGTSKRITGFLIPGAIAYVFAVFPQLFVDLGLIVPRWVLFAVFGAILLSVAARYEHLQTLRDESGSWNRVFK